MTTTSTKAKGPTPDSDPEKSTPQTKGTYMAMASSAGLWPVVPTDEEIQETVTAFLDDVDAPTSDGWNGRVEDVGQADWALRKLVRVREQRAAVIELATRQVSAIQAAVKPHIVAIEQWEDGEVQKLDAEEAHWEALLTGYHRRLITDDPKAPRTIHLPHGALEARANPPVWTFDDATFIEWVKANGRADLVRVVPAKDEVDKNAAKKAIAITHAGVPVLDVDSVAPDGTGYSEIAPVPGVTVVPGEIKFHVSTQTAEPTI